MLAIVTPHAGVWIETDKISFEIGNAASLPMRECGLKQPSRLFTY